MTHLFSSRRLAVGLLLASLAYAAVMLLLVTQFASAHHLLDVREENQTTWNSQFQNNQALSGFPSTTRYHIRQGMYQWDDVNTGADFDVDEAYSGYDTYVMPRSFYSSNRPDVPAGTTNYKNNDSEITYSIIALNSDWDWDDEDDTCLVDWEEYFADVRIITTHESRHLISLGHSSEDDAVMNADDTCKLTTVYDDDHMGVIEAYGED